MKVTITAVVLLALFIGYIEGFDSIIMVTKLGDDIPFGEDETVTTVMRGDSTLRNSCCIYRNCSCQSLYNALANLTSNILINITTDVELSSIIQRVNLANITITGYNNPTVNCNNSGGLHFISCSNCTIEGITWKRCGSRIISDNGNPYSVLHLTDSSNIIIQNCTFQHSVGQAVVLSGVTGDVTFTSSSFLHGKHYKGHGTAIHYSSNNNKLIVSLFNILVSNCSFFYNGKAESIVYFDQASNKHYEFLNLRDSKFSYNKGVPIYLHNQDLHIGGNVKFYNNIAEYGGAIFVSDHSNVIFHRNYIVEFTNNRSYLNGGAIFLTNSSGILFNGCSTSSQCYDHNELYDISGDQLLTNSFTTCTVKFYNNTARFLGNDIYTYNSSIAVDGNAKVMFGGEAMIFRYRSGAVYIDDFSTVTFKGDSVMTFSNNILNGDFSGGALYIENSNVTFEGNSKVIFNHNHAVVESVYGGAVYIGDYSIVTFLGNSTVQFNDNRANSGGALHITNATITFEGNSKVVFNDNFAIIQPNSFYGGAVYITDLSTITFKGNSTITFNNNQADNGGALYIHRSTVLSKGNTKVTFDNNKANKGGAVYLSHLSTSMFEGNSIIKFNEGTSINGGAVYSDESVIAFKENSTTTLNNNQADNSGGAVYINHLSTITCNSLVPYGFDRYRADQSTKFGTVIP